MEHLVVIKINDNVNRRTRIGSSTPTIGTSDDPAPILLELKPIAKVVTNECGVWPTWQEDGVTLK